MGEEEKKAIDILENVIADEVICTYCTEFAVPKYNCNLCVDKNGKPDDCYYEKAIDIVLNLIEKQQAELENKNKVINLMAKGILNIDKEIGQENNRENKIKQTSDELTEETRYYTPEGEIYKTIIETYKSPKNYISKDKIRDKIKEIKYYEKIQPSDNTYTYKELIQYGEEILQELLEERN